MILNRYEFDYFYLNENSYINQFPKIIIYIYYYICMSIIFYRYRYYFNVKFNY